MISRKRSLLIEKVNSNLLEAIQNQGRHFYNTPLMKEFYHKNRFCLELENDFKGLKIDSLKIRAFEMNSKTISVVASLNIDEWIELFKNVRIAKIYIFDAYGNVVRFFDYDIELIDYKIEFDYNSDDIMFPVFHYKFF